MTRPPDRELIDAYIADLEVDVAAIDKIPVEALSTDWAILRDQYRAEIAALRAAELIVVDRFGIPHATTYAAIAANAIGAAS